MGFFSRKNKAVAEEPKPETEVEPTAQPTQCGPLDYAHATADNDLENYLDFGAILLPPVVGMRVMPELAPGTEEVGSLTVQLGTVAVQMMVSSSTKSGQLWPEVLEELQKDLTKQGADYQVTEGHFGQQVQAKVPAATASGQKGYVQMLFAGVDGPNWFARLVFNSLDTQAEDFSKLVDLLDKTVVRRDAAPRPPREILPLSLPTELPGAQTEE